MSQNSQFVAVPIDTPPVRRPLARRRGPMYCLIGAVAALSWVGVGRADEMDDLAAKGQYEQAAAAYRKAVADGIAGGADVGALRVRFARFLQTWIEQNPKMTSEKSGELQRERLRQLRAALEADADNRDARALISDAHWQAAVLLGSWRPLLDSVTEQIRLDPKNAEAYYRAAMAHVALAPDQPQHITLADRAFTRATELAPTNVDYYLQWAQFHARRNKPQRAMEIFKLAVRSNPTSPHLLAVYARFLLAIDPAAAATQLARAEAAEKQTVESCLAIGQYHLIQTANKPADLDKAVAALQRARAAAPRDPRPYLWLARAERQRSRPDAGIAAAREGLKVAESAAASSFEQRLDQRKAEVELHAHLAGLLLDKWASEPDQREKVLADAKISVDRLAELAPRHPAAAKIRGRYALAKGDLIEAEKLLRLAYDTNPVFDREVAALLIQVYVAQNQLGEAEAVFARIHQAVPDDGGVLLDMAQLQIRLGRPEQARKHLESAAARSLTDEGKVRLRMLRRTVARALGEPVEKLTVPEKITDEAIAPLAREARQLAATGQTDLAVEIYDAILAQHPATEALVAELTELYRQADQLDKAKATVATGLKHLPASDRLKALQAILNAANAEERDRILLDYVHKHEAGEKRELRIAAIYRGRGDRKAYREHLLKALEIEPASPAAIEALFTDYLAMREYEQAAGMIDKARAANLDGAGGALYRARMALAKQEWDEAVRLLEGVLAKRKRFSAGHVMLGQAYLGKNELYTAKWHFLNAARQDPTSTTALMGLAQIADLQTARRDFSSAADTLRQARQVNSRSVGILVRLARVYLATQDFKALDGLLEEGRRFGRKDPTWWTLEAEIWRARGQTDRMADALGQAYTLAGDGLTLLRYLDALVTAKQYAKAQSVAAGATGLTGEVAPQVKALAARAAVGAGDVDGGVRGFAEAMSLCTGAEALGVAAQMRLAVGPTRCMELLTRWAAVDADWPAQLALSQEYATAEKFTEARAMIAKALPKTTGRARFVLLRNLAGILNIVGEYAAAEKPYRDALKINPDSAEVLNNLAYLLADKLNKPAEAVPMARKAAQLSRGDPNVLDTLGWACVQAGQLDEAEQALRESLRRRPLAATHYHLGQLLEKKDEKAEAVRQYRAGKLRLAGKPDDRYFKLCDERIKALERP